MVRLLDSILYGFKLQTFRSSIDYRHPNDQRKGSCARNLWIEGADSLGSQKAHWSIAGLSIRGGQGTGQNTMIIEVPGCDISGCKGSTTWYLAFSYVIKISLKDKRN